ncbi:hypothetical protein EYF80_027636 [Liparis tanakae]|uniref:Uncharacterized protein n=1 Tax=Liparis tanakae TaxID=230148 RepID=A0A4Z2H8P3_9TELE|nr:hypothetical protein EYF80_027636 [Liparis tanakae]
MSAHTDVINSWTTVQSAAAASVHRGHQEAKVRKTVWTALRLAHSGRLSVGNQLGSEEGVCEAKSQLGLIGICKQ